MYTKEESSRIVKAIESATINMDVDTKISFIEKLGFDWSTDYQEGVNVDIPYESDEEKDPLCELYNVQDVQMLRKVFKAYEALPNG